MDINRDKPDPLPDPLALPPLPVLTSERIMLRGPRDADIDDRLRPYLIDAVRRGMRRTLAGRREGG